MDLGDIAKKAFRDDYMDSRPTGIPPDILPEGMAVEEASQPPEIRPEPKIKKTPELTKSGPVEAEKGSKTLKLKNVRSRLEQVYDKISLGAQNRRNLYNKNFEDFQWEIEKTEPVFDAEGVRRQYARELKLPAEILEDVEKFEVGGAGEGVDSVNGSKGPKTTGFNYFKDFFQIGNAAYFVLANRVYLWFFEDGQRVLVHDFEKTVKNLCKFCCFFSFFECFLLEF